MAYTELMWTELKTEYESGKYLSLRDMYVKYVASKGKASKLYPSLKAMEARQGRDRWDKKAIQPSIEQNRRQKIIEALASQGYDHNKIAGCIGKLLDAKKAGVIPSNVQGESGMVDFTDDPTGIDKGLTQYFKVTGDIDPDQKTGQLKTPPMTLEVIIKNAST
jgi:hypothetical protein